MVIEGLQDRDAFARWFAGYTTAPKHPEVDWRPEAPVGAATLRAGLGAGIPLRRNPASRFAFLRRDARSLSLFVDGEAFDCADDAAELAERICASGRVVVDPAVADSPVAVALLSGLIDRGSLAFDTA